MGGVVNMHLRITKEVRGISLPGAGVTGSGKLPDISSGTKLISSAKQYGFLTVQPSLQPHKLLNYHTVSRACYKVYVNNKTW